MEPIIQHIAVHANKKRPGNGLSVYCIALTNQLVSQIILSDGRTLSYEYDAEERITKVTDSIDGTTENGHTMKAVSKIKEARAYDTEGEMTKKVITPASGSVQTIYYETNAWVWNGISKLLF